MKRVKYKSLQISVKTSSRLSLNIDVKVCENLEYIPSNKVIVHVKTNKVEVMEDKPLFNSKITYIHDLPIIEQVVEYQLTPLDKVRIEGIYRVYYPDNGYVTLEDTQNLLSKILDSVTRVPCTISNTPLSLNQMFIQKASMYFK